MAYSVNHLHNGAVAYSWTRYRWKRASGYLSSTAYGGIGSRSRSTEISQRTMGRSMGTGTPSICQPYKNHEAYPICFEEYSQPKRKDRSEAQPPIANTSATSMYSPTTVDASDLSRADAEMLNNQGESLRLLDCGHIFHARAAYSLRLRISSRLFL